ncbi:pentatricopeptide repeat-containing protein At4g18520, chloroplastic [Typha latifolia]|uniref:pentatricopeptide repeat-containing protein At4g18520, chloroplastic n=1 Tax=Typha latifolia TaxID=4733 RepID=UPI003C2F90DA
MLVYPSLSFPHFHPPLLIPSPQFPPYPSKEERRKPARKKSPKRTIKSHSFTSKDPSFPTRTEENLNSASSQQNPVGNSTETFSAPQYDLKSLASHIKSCSNFKEFKSVHAIVVRLLDSSVAFVGNNLISGYLRFHELQDARKVFDGLLERNVVSWTAILNGYLKVGRYDELLELLKEMIEDNVEGNSLMYVSLLKYCGNRFDFELGRQVHACVVKGRWNNLIVDSALVYFYSQCGDLLAASIVFSNMPTRDVVSWTTMITAYVQHGQGYEAFSVFSEMQYLGFHPNEFTVCSVLKACGEAKALRFGKQLHGAIVKGMYEEDVYIGSSLMTMYIRCGEVSDARVVFNLMPKRNTIAWTSMISGYAQSGFGEEAILLFQRMRRRRVFANNLTIVSILTACGSIESLYLGKEVHGQIFKNLVLENIHIGSTLIWFYCKCGEYDYAARVLETMPARDVVSWTAMISGYSSLGYGSEALGLLNDMLWDGVKPNTFTYSSALKACAKLESVRFGKWIHASVNKTTALANVFVGSSLIDMYMRCGDVADALRVFNTMPERNLVTWKIMVIGYAKNGFCREAMNLMYRMQEEGFYVDDFVRGTVLSACGDVQWESDHASVYCPLSGSLSMK